MGVGGDEEEAPQWEPACKVADDDLKAVGAAFRAVACASDLVIAASSRPVLKVWKVAQAKLADLQKLSHGAVGSSCVEVSGNGVLMLACSDDGAITLWDLRERRLAGELQASIPTAWTAKFLVDGYRIVSGGPSGSVCFWDLRMSRLQNEIAANLAEEPDPKRHKRDKGSRAHPELGARKQAVGIYSLALSGDGMLLACGRSSGDVSIMRVQEQQWVGADVSAHQAEDASPVRALAFDSASRLLLSGGDDSHVCLLDAASLARKRPGGQAAGSVAASASAKLERFSAHRSWVTSLSVCPDPTRRVVLTTSWDSTVKLWDYRTQRLLRTYKEHAESVFASSFQPADGHFFVSAGSDAQVALYTAKEPGNEAALVPVSGPS